MFSGSTPAPTFIFFKLCKFAVNQLALITLVLYLEIIHLKQGLRFHTYNTKNGLI